MVFSQQNKGKALFAVADSKFEIWYFNICVISSGPFGLLHLVA